MSSKPATGKCLCGAVRFTADGFKPEYHACHCGMCRRWSGGAPFFAVPCKSVTFDSSSSSSSADSIGRFTSSDWAERGFCKNCGTTIFYFLKPTGQYSMSVGTFDDPAMFKLAGEIFIDKKPDGYDLAGDHPRLTEAEVFAKYAPPAPPPPAT